MAAAAALAVPAPPGGRRPAALGRGRHGPPRAALALAEHGDRRRPADGAAGLLRRVRVRRSSRRSCSRRRPATTRRSSTSRRARARCRRSARRARAAVRARVEAGDGGHPRRRDRGLPCRCARRRRADRRRRSTSSATARAGGWPRSTPHCIPTASTRSRSAARRSTSTPAGAPIPAYVDGFTASGATWASTARSSRPAAASCRGESQLLGFIALKPEAEIAQAARAPQPPRRPRAPASATRVRGLVQVDPGRSRARSTSGSSSTCSATTRSCAARWTSAGGRSRSARSPARCTCSPARGTTSRRPRSCSRWPTHVGRRPSRRHPGHGAGGPPRAVHGLGRAARRVAVADGGRGAPVALRPSDGPGVVQAVVDARGQRRDVDAVEAGEATPSSARSVRRGAPSTATRVAPRAARSRSRARRRSAAGR